MVAPLKVLTYNVCFGCMLGSERDTSARRLALRCAASGSPPTANRCLKQVARNVDVAGDCCGGLDLVGLQEASAWELLRQHSRELAAKRPVVTQVGPEELVLFLDRRLEVLWLGEGAVSGRPLQLLLLRDLRDGASLFVVHLHNHHRAQGATPVLLRSIAAVSGVNEALLRASEEENLTVLCMGDWNDAFVDRRGLRPFALCACPAPLRALTVSAVASMPKSCCSTEKEARGRTMAFVGDYVLSNGECRNEIPERLLAALQSGDASDHFAVLAVVRRARPHPVVIRALAAAARVRGAGSPHLPV